MDTPQTVNCLEWFFGYGGNHIGLKRVVPGLRCVAACEIEAYAVANMVSKMEAGLMDPFPIWTDCKTFPCESFRGLVDLFVASYPCQGESMAGDGKGITDPRFLWPYVLRAIVIIRPRRVFFENVEGHINRSLRRVLSDLEKAGYRHEEGIFSAAECGAPQQRKRVFILAESKSDGRSRRQKGERSETRTNASRDGERTMADTSAVSGQTGAERSGRETRPNVGGRCEGAELADASIARSGPVSGSEGRLASSNADGASENMANPSGIGERESNDTQCAESRERTRENSGGGSGVGQADANDTRPQGRISGELQECSGERATGENGSLHWPGFVSRPGEQQHEWEPPRVIETVRGLGGGVNGRAANVDRLRLLGNGVYPECAARAYVYLSEKLKSR